MIYQSVPIEPIIARIIRNTKIQDPSYILDMDEWIQEALELLQTRFDLSPKGPVDVDIAFHKGKFPCGLVSVTAVEYCGRRLKERSSAINKMVKDTGDPWYAYELGFILTSFQDGKVTLYYKAMAIDSNGLPLIPDNGDYKEALYYYVRAKMVGCGYKDTVFSEQQLMDRFELHGSRAIGAISYPSVDSMEAKVASMTRLIPAQNYFDNYFKVDGEESMYGGDGPVSSDLPIVITSTGTGVPVDQVIVTEEDQWTVKQF